MEVEGGERRRNQAADDSPGHFVRLDAREIHAGAGAVSLGARGVLAFVSRGIDLSRAVHGELVPALPDGDQRSGSGAQRAQREFVVSAVSGGGRGWEFVVVATTRPETMLGDTAVAVHPDDERYAGLIGKKVALPLAKREIPIIADAAVDREFGTGAVKITPAHDPNDFEMGKRHNLPQIDVMNDTAHMNENAGAYAGLERFAARGRVVKDLEEQGLIEKITEHTHSVGTCDRCKSIVEPRVSTQWFMKMRPMADDARRAVTGEFGAAAEIEVVPDNQRTILLQWFENIRDWCISRQLWWGHRIPIWHCAGCSEMVPATDSRVEIVDGHARAASAPTACPKCGSAKLVQDKDVLDTWFSSALWPFSTLGWPDNTQDLRDYYPTNLLISGYDIIFFWDARMIMMGLHLSGATGEGAANPPVTAVDAAARIPFRRLYLHSLVRTAEGAKMSKTKGTGVDPLELTQKFGTDALRYMLASMAAPGTDIILSEDRILGARAFANKIWNAARFLFMNLEKAEAAGGGFSLEELAAPDVRAGAPYATGGASDLVHRWMFSRLAAVAAETSKALDEFRFHEACKSMYQFFWGDFCDWYIEWVKPELASANREAAVAAWRNIFALLDASIRLLHPVMPFLTEELWHKLPQPAGARTIALDQFPEARAGWADADADSKMALAQEIITVIRNLRAANKIDQKKKLNAEYVTDDKEVLQVIEQNGEAIARFGGLSAFVRGEHKVRQGVVYVGARFEIVLDEQELSGTEKAEAIAKLEKEIERLTKDVESKSARLADEAFTSKAPEKVLATFRSTLKERETELEKLKERLKQLA